MRVRLLAILSVFYLLSCADDEIPGGLFDYQVERLLSEGDTAQWLLTSQIIDNTRVTPESCNDSTQLFVRIIDGDSINISFLVPNADCSTFDTTKLGDANASGDILFTDSILFDSGDYWRIFSITSRNLSLELSNNTQQFYSKSE